jgi:two-component system, chemotaxis family, sensor kinase CheA
MMKLYPDYIEQLANRLSKEVNIVKIVGGDFLVDISIYKNLVSSLIHIFRNAIDHGIEDTEERISKNKSEVGCITCNIDLKDKQIIIDISDDGKGIDLEKIKETSIEKHMKLKEELETMSEEELIDFIFIEEFSTRKNPNELSGRGIGLPSFVHELKKLNGSVKVITKAEVGTSFIIMIPDVETEEISM